VVAAVLAGGAAYRAGVLAGDEIVALAGRELEAEDLEHRLEGYQPGDQIVLHVMRYGRLKELPVVLDGRALGDWKLRRIKSPTPEQKKNYESWIGQAWPTKKS
jgi:predicted metalloprotease with PDZ domain